MRELIHIFVYLFFTFARAILVSFVFVALIYLLGKWLDENIFMSFISWIS